MGVRDEIEAKLRQTFVVDFVAVVDDSERHRGHAGYREGGESHFNVTIKAPEFAGMSRIARHRAVHAAIGHDLVGQIHALALDVRV